MAASAAGALAPGLRILTDGLKFPEGPVMLADGSVVLVEIAGACITRVWPDGRKAVVAETGGGPNGAALGPDGALYVCNNGGFTWARPNGGWRPAAQPVDYVSGLIQRVDLATGAVTTLYDRCGDHILKGPNDIVFDEHGGFYFTDLGKRRARDRDLGGLYYAQPDGSSIVEVAFGLDTPNGVGLSPDGKTVYFAETATARLWAYDLESPGVAKKGDAWPTGARLIGTVPGMVRLDSLAVQANGDICVATLNNGGITVFSPDGGQRFVPTGDDHTTNICFGGPDLKTAYITLSTLGALAVMDWEQPGLKLHYEGTA